MILQGIGSAITRWRERKRERGVKKHRNVFVSSSLFLHCYLPVRLFLSLYTHTHTHTHTRTYTYIYTHIHTYTHMYTYVCLSVYLPIYLHVSLCCLSFFLSLSLSAYVLMYDYIYVLFVGVDYTYIDVNALAQGIKSFLASHVWFQAVAGARTYGTDSPAITSQPP